MNNISVDILMATYNGEKYVESQMLSLMQQTYKEWKLFAYDDGSSDGTVNILKKYAEIDQRINIVGINSENALGAGKAFLELTKISTADYVMFCDQDDVWFEKKLEILLSFAVNNFCEEKPSLVYCDAYGYSSTDGIITIDSVSRLHAKKLKDFLFFNAGYQGCSILFNRNLCQFVSSYKAKFFYMHDDVVSLVAHVFGDVFFLDKKLMLYRQHDKNVTGNIKVGAINRILSFLLSRKSVVSRVHYDEKYSFYKSYKNLLSEDDERIFNYYFEYVNSNIIRRLIILLYGNFTLGGNRIPLFLKTILRKAIG